MATTGKVLRHRPRASGGARTSGGQNGGFLRVPIIGHATVHLHADLKETLRSAMRQTHRLVLDLADLDEIDMTGLQLFLSVRREAREAGGDLYLENVPARHESKIRLLGLGDLLHAGETRAAA